MLALIALHFLFSFPLDDQRPRAPLTNARGLLSVNRDYYELAARTGGDFYFWAAGEFASARLEIPVVAEEVVLSYGSVERKRIFEVPVESGARSLTLFAGVQRKDLITIVRPDGTVVREGQVFQHMTIATIASPVAGTWRLELEGAGTFAVTSHVTPRRGGIELISAEFVERRGRPGHEGLFPVELVPRGGVSAICRIHLGGDARNVRLAFFRRDATLISSVPIAAAEDGEYIGRCEVPGEAFRFGVTGTDDDGLAFRRMDRALREPSR